MYEVFGEWEVNVNRVVSIFEKFGYVLESFMIESLIMWMLGEERICFICVIQWMLRWVLEERSNVKGLFDGFWLYEDFF